MKPNFEAYNNTKNLVVYDYNSVMHYSKNAFSKFQYLPAIQVCFLYLINSKNVLILAVF